MATSTTTHKFKSKSKLRDAKEVPGQNYRLLENIAELNFEGTASWQKSLKNISLEFFTGLSWKTVVNTKARLSTTNAIQNGKYEIDGFRADQSTADFKVCTFVLNKITKIQGEILTFKFSLHTNPSKSVVFPIKNLLIEMMLNKGLQSIQHSNSQASEQMHSATMITNCYLTGTDIKLNDHIDISLIIPQGILSHNEEYKIGFTGVGTQKIEKISLGEVFFTYEMNTSNSSMMDAGDKIIYEGGEKIGHLKNMYFVLQIGVATLKELIDTYKLEIQATLAIDFSSSSRKYHKPIDPSGDSVCAEAIRSLFGILQELDSDKDIPCFGFGAVKQGHPLDLHNDGYIFRLSGDINKETATNTEQVIEWYKSSMKGMAMKGTTDFSPILKRNREIYKSSAEDSTRNGKRLFSVVLIITDGEIKDEYLENTINEIIECSKLHMSIIIVGIGNSDFKGMEKLDGDDEKLKNKAGIQVLRDIVQFLKYEDFKQDPNLLKEEFTKELPEHIKEALSNQNIK